MQLIGNDFRPLSRVNSFTRDSSSANTDEKRMQIAANKLKKRLELFIRDSSL
jgi:hypothetical protein